MRVIGFIILSLFLTACGKSSTKTNYQPPLSPTYNPLFSDSDPELTLIADEFYTEYFNKKGSIYNGELPPINFYDLKKLNFLNSSETAEMIDYDLDYEYNSANNQTKMAAVCLSYPSGEREILIDAAVWSSIGQGFSCGDNNCYERKRALIFHELGHCVLNRDHKNTKYENYNLSMMNSVLLRQNDVVRWGDAYLEELFSTDHTHLETEIYNYVMNN